MCSRSAGVLFWAIIGACAGAAAPVERAAGQVRVWNNGPFVTNPGAGFNGADVSATQSGVPIGLGINELAAAPNGPIRIADSFTVSGSGLRGWRLQRLDWYGFQSNNTNPTTVSPFTGAFVGIYAGSPLNGAPLLHGDFSVNRLIRGVWTGAYRTTSTFFGSNSRAIQRLEIDMTWVPPLPDGTYFVSVGLADAAAPTLNLFGVPITPQVVGEGNATQFFGGQWFVTGIDFPFELYARCAADYNQSGTVTVQDLFDFLSEYFAEAPATDVDGSGALGVQDVFTFLERWFTGC